MKKTLIFSILSSILTAIIVIVGINIFFNVTPKKLNPTAQETPYCQNIFELNEEGTYEVRHSGISCECNLQPVLVFQILMGEYEYE